MARNKTRPRRSGSGVRTNIVLDQRLVAQVKRLARVSTAREAVQAALEHYTRSRDYSAVQDLFGKGGIAADYDPKAAAPAER